ncbi:MAG: hypothetical protein Q7S92_07065, partial [Candidatus Diapherotrites archaeon]|nr:hypothetical protein [Candidatus Diapherotrites archaeon]
MVFEALKEFYFKLEEKWYGFLDKIDARIPIYKVIEPIDRVVPSFAVFLVLILILGVFLIASVLGPGNTVDYSLKAVSQGSPIAGASVTFSYDGLTEPITKITNAEGITEKIQVPKGTSVNYAVTKTGYNTIAGIEVVEQSLQSEIVLIPESTGTTIKFYVKNNGQLLTGVPLTVTFSCSGSNTAPATIYNQIQPFDGFEVEKTEECGQLRATVNAVAGFLGVDGQPIADGGEILLAEDIPNTGTLIVNLTAQDPAGLQRPLTTESISVNLFKADNGFAACPGLYESVEYSTAGQVSFNIPAGTYCVQSNGTGEYSSQTSDIVQITANGTQTVQLELEKNVVGRIKIQALDTRNRALEGVSVKLFDGSNQREFRTTSLDNNAIAEFAVDKTTGFTVYLTKDGYKPKGPINVAPGETVTRINLEQCIGTECATLKLKVVNSDGKGIANAVVGLFDSQGFAVPRSPDKLITDVNGAAKFVPVDNGTYKVFAFKGLASGWSDVQEFQKNRAGEIVYTVVLEIPNGSLQVNVQDKDGHAVPFALVSVRDSYSNELIQGFTPTDNNGSILFDTIPGGTKVYILSNFNDPSRSVSYTRYISQPIEINPAELSTHTVVLEPEIISGDLQAKFIGLFKDGTRVQNVTPGEEYTARFQIRIPSNKIYTQIGLHARTGVPTASTSPGEKMETDPWFVKSVSVPAGASLWKGTSLHDRPDALALLEDSSNLSKDGSKWVNIVYPQTFTGLMNLDVVLKVKETAGLDEQLSLYWRAWAQEGTSLVRVPSDASFASTASFADLRAATNEEQFSTGEESTCIGIWCFSATALDTESDLMVSANNGFSANIGRQYKLKFTLVNTSESERDSFFGAQIRIAEPTETSSILGYKVRDVTGRELAHARGLTGFDGIDSDFTDLVGDVKPNSRITGEIDLLTEQPSTSQVTLQLKSANRIVYSKVLNVQVLAREEFTIEFQKENSSFSEDLPTLSTGVEQTLVLKIKNKRTSVEVQGTQVYVKDRFGNIIATTTETSNELGIARIRLPAIRPGETIQLYLVKPDYKPLVVDLTADTTVVKVTPERLGYALNPKTIKENTRTINVRNATEFGVTIDTVDLRGDLKGLIDQPKAIAYIFSQLTGREISAKSSVNIDVRLALSDLGLQLNSPVDLQGNLVIIASALGEQWITETPVLINIGIGGEVENPACLNVDKDSWTDAATEGQPVSLQLRVENNCTIEGIPIELKNLQAQVHWKGNKLGNYSLTIGNDTVELRESYFKLVNPRVLEDSRTEAILTFTPDGGVSGLGEATIEIKAENPTSASVQELSDSLTTQIGVVSLGDCIRYNRDLFKLKKGEETTFEIETKNCGATVDFKFESELDLSTKQASLQGTDKQMFTILTDPSQTSGQYQITVLARGAGFLDYRESKLLRVRVTGDECFELSRYEFDVFDDPATPFDAFDTAKVINKCVKKEQQFKVHYDNSCFWSNKESGGFGWNSLGGMAGGMLVGGLLGGFGVGGGVAIAGGIIAGGSAGASIAGIASGEADSSCLGTRMALGAGIGGMTGLAGSFGSKTAKVLGGAAAIAAATTDAECDKFKNAEWKDGKCQEVKEGTTAPPAGTKKLGEACAKQEDCGKDLTCESNICKKTIAVPGTPKATGEACTNNSECASSYCDSSTNKCAEITSVEFTCQINGSTVTAGQTKKYCSGGKLITETCGTTGTATKIEEECESITGRRCSDPLAGDSFCEVLPGTGLPGGGPAARTNIPIGTVCNTGDTCVTGATCTSGVCIATTGGSPPGTITRPAKLQAECQNTPHETSGIWWISADNAKCSDPSSSANLKCISKINFSPQGDYTKRAGATQAAIADTKFYCFLGAGQDCQDATWCASNVCTANKCVGETPGATAAPATEPLVSTGARQGLVTLANLQSKNPTGFQGLGAQNSGFGLQQLGNGFGSMLGGVGGLIGAGITNPLAGAGLGAITGATTYLFSDREGEVTKAVIVNDIPELDSNAHFKLLAAELATIPDTNNPTGFIDEPPFDGISIAVGTAKEKPNPADFRKPLHEFEIQFRNTGNVKQVDPFTPLKGILKVGGTEIRNIYCESISEESKETGNNVIEGISSGICKDNPTQTEITEAYLQEKIKDKQSYFEKIKVQFNSFKPEEALPTPLGLESCRIGSRIGSTGTQAAPKVLYSWKWNSILVTGSTTRTATIPGTNVEIPIPDPIEEARNQLVGIGLGSCDEGNRNNIYCDSTQFTIELLKKIQLLEKELQPTRNASCPASSRTASRNTQELSTTTRDVTVSKVEAVPITGTNNVKITVELKSNNDIETAVPYELTVTSSGVGVTGSPIRETRNVVSTSSKDFNFNDLTAGTYEVKVRLMTSAGETGIQCTQEPRDQCINGDT